VTPGASVPRPVLLALGWVCVALGLTGVLIPGMPTTVFLLIAAWCFLRSSPRAHQWLLNHPVLGPYVRDYLSGNGMPLKAKIISIGAMWTACSLSAWLFVPNQYGKGALLVAAAIGSAFVLRVPTRRP